MNKKERCKLELTPLLEEIRIGKKFDILFDYLVKNSNLPGRRANLELASAFIELIKSLMDVDLSKQLCEELIAYDSLKAPSNSPQEFLAFSGTWALGVLGSTYKQEYNQSLELLYQLSSDERWRIREAVAKALNMIVEKYPTETIPKLKNWIVKGDWLQMRAVAAGMASPSLLRDKTIAHEALKLHNHMFELICNGNEVDYKSNDYRILRKGLAYTLSVVVEQIPEDGFRNILTWIESKNKEIAWIMKENLKKNRLKKSFPEKVEQMIVNTIHY